MAERDDRFWANFLGLTPSDWQVPGVSVSAHRGLGDYNGLWSFRHGERVAVSAPPAWLERLRALVEGVPLPRLSEPGCWQELLGDDCARVIGPAYQGCLDPLGFRASADPAVCAIEGDASATRAEFRQTMDDEAWADGGLEKAPDFVAVRREAGQAVAMCGYRAWSADAGDPCVLVHPQFRGRGYGSAVVSAVVARALLAGKTLLYQTLESNLGAVGIAAKLGFQQYGRHVAVRLR